MPKEKPVWAAHARWKHEEKGGEVTAIIGTFSRDDRAAAKGCAKHLHKKGWVDKHFAPERYSDAHILRLTRKEGHDLEAFEEWAHKHNLLPQLAHKREYDRHTALLAEMQEERLHEYRFEPPTSEQAKELIRHAHWQLMETMPAQTRKDAKKHPPVALIAASTEPRSAFQLAYYLEKKGYIRHADFERLNTEVNHALDHPEEQPEFRLSVTKKLDKFMEKFPETGGAPPPEPQGHAPHAARSQKPKERGLFP